MTKPLEYIEWLDLWVTGADRNDLPRLLLVGDSIARSYFSVVDQALMDRYHCARLCTSTCVCDAVFIRELSLLLDEYTFDVVHFNNGLHGGGYDLATYRAGLERTWDFIAAHAPDARCIWAASTPVRVGLHVVELNTKQTEWVAERNRMAAEIAVARSIQVNDLFTPVLEHPEYFAEDGVHYNDAGVQVLGNAVVKAIRG
ncbi:MAG: SGNH/GDSL hydrolase family protein [Anaerolineae bacterium]